MGFEGASTDPACPAKRAKKQMACGALRNEHAWTKPLLEAKDRGERPRDRRTEGPKAAGDQETTSLPSKQRDYEKCCLIVIIVVC